MDPVSSEDQPDDVEEFHPTMVVDSRSWVSDSDRFGRLFLAGFRDDPTVQAAMQRVEQLIEPLAVVDEALQRESWRYAADVKPEAADRFAHLYYSAMRNGWSAAEAVLHARGIEIGEVDADAFAERLSALTARWSDTNPWNEFSDLAYYLLDDITPALQEHVEQLLKAVVPDVELPSGWELLPPLRMPLDRAINGLLFAAATAMAAAGHDAL